MTNLADEVRNFLNKNQFIAKCLNYEIINTRALSAYILKEAKLESSLHAIISAIRRYQKEKEKFFETQRKNLIADTLKDSKLSTKSRLVMLTAKRNFSVLRNIIPDIIDHIDSNKGEVLRFVEGRESIKFIIDHSKKQEIINLIPKDQLIGVMEDLAEINVHLSEKYGDMHGLNAAVLNELAINDINLIDAIGCTPEIIIIIKEKDISKSHDTLLRFFYSK